jgi:hypothetical protein
MLSLRSSVATTLKSIVPILTVMLLPVAVAQADFGIEPGSLAVRALNRDGTIDTQAGSHPYAFRVRFSLNREEKGFAEGGEARGVVVKFPAGFLGNPAALPQCTMQEFEGSEDNCPLDTQIGVLRAQTGIGEIVDPLVSLKPPPGYAAEFGVSSLGFTALQYATVRAEVGPHGEAAYGVNVTSPDLPLEITGAEETIWGEPADAGHNAERGGKALNGGPPEPSELPLKPFVTLPAECGVAPAATVIVEPKLPEVALAEEATTFTDAGGNPAAMTGCASVPFSPKVSAAPSTTAADSSSGLDFELKLPNQGLLDPGGITETEPEKTEVILPEGVTINPSAASGQGVCSEAEYQSTTAQTEPGQGCPESSKVGTLVAKTPLLEEAIEGSVYLAAPHANPFNSLLALYIVAKAPERGVLIKQAGEVSADPSTGQLRTTFDGLPPLPYSSFLLELRGGPRAPLSTPTTCGTYATVTKLYPFSDPTVPVERSSSFQVTSGPGGGACSASEAQEPNDPNLQAGTATPLAAGYSPFVLKLNREDGSQRFSAFNVTLPPGLTGKIAGVAQCSDAQLAAAAARGGFGEGALEQASPSCPASSELGTVTVGAGSGAPLYVSGRAYLAGPYKGAPFSLAIITPAIAGPFDLGDVVVRSALYINAETAQVTVKSDPLPTILEGIPLDIRSIALSISRPGFMLNPSSCEAMTLSGEAISTTGQTAPLSNRLQVGGCAGLPFKPSLTAVTQAKTSKADGASLTITVAQKSGEANIHKVQLQIPKALPTRLTTLQQACTEAQFDTNPADCPAGSYIGTATAHTPLLATPLIGPAVLVSHGGAAFPDVEFLLTGEGINITLDGKTDIKAGVTYSRFETVPDVPISSFKTTLSEGPHSIFTATGNLCEQALGIPTTIIGQNGAQLQQETSLKVEGCPNSLYVTSRHIKNGGASIIVNVPSAGRLVATASGLNKGAVKASRARQNVTVRLTLTSKERSFLSKHKGRRLKAKVHLRFRPTSGRQLTAVTTVLIG